MFKEYSLILVLFPFATLINSFNFIIGKERTKAIIFKVVKWLPQSILEKLRVMEPIDEEAITINMEKSVFLWIGFIIGWIGWRIISWIF
jgi:hypothetical protein